MAAKQKKLYKIEVEGMKTRFYSSKMLAKRERVMLTEQGYAGLYIARGPDQWRGETGNVVG